MTLSLDKLAALIKREQGALLASWREQVRRLPSAKHLDSPTLNDHIPDLINELVTAFQMVADQPISEAVLEGTPPAHGLQRYEDGFDIVEVVAEYNILRGCVYDMAEQAGLGLHGSAFHILNRFLDEAIGLAVQTFATQQALEVQRRRDEYLAFVAHDLRTPLNAISLAARVLEFTLTGRGDSTQTPRMLKTLQRNVQQIQALGDRVLKESAHVQSESGVKLARRQIDLWPLVEALIYDIQPVADTAGTRLINKIHEDLTAYADAGLLRRAFQNLVANAITYTPHGEIVISARETETAGSVECLVSDNGAGIPQDRLTIIFDKLETDPQKEGGTGLGLAIVKAFIEAHGGEVDVKSQEGVGSTFRFTLPGRGKLSDA